MKRKTDDTFVYTTRTGAAPGGRRATTATGTGGTRKWRACSAYGESAKIIRQNFPGRRSRQGPDTRYAHANVGCPGCTSTGGCEWQCHSVSPSQFLRAHGVSPRAKTVSFAQTQRVYNEDANRDSGSREAHRVQRNAHDAASSGAYNQTDESHSNACLAGGGDCRTCPGPYVCGTRL